MNTNNEIEQEIQEKGLVAPRVTPAEIEANIASEYYFSAEEGVIGKCVNRLALDGLVTYPSDLPKRNKNLSVLTFCVLVLRNGFTVTGESACASPENFNAEIGCKIARENAVQKIWPLMGYALKDTLSKN